MHLATGPGSIVSLPNTGHVQVPQLTTTFQGTNATSVCKQLFQPQLLWQPPRQCRFQQSPFPQVMFFRIYQPGRFRQDQVTRPVFPTVLPATSVTQQLRLLSQSPLEEQYTILTRRL